VRISMRHAALELTFRMLLSCQCPLTDEQEWVLFDRLVALKPGHTMDCTEFLSIFKPNENTPIQRPVHFSVWMAPASSREIVIEREHVLRHFAAHALLANRFVKSRALNWIHLDAMQGV
jgi:hypothetical protein